MKKTKSPLPLCAHFALACLAIVTALAGCATQETKSISSTGLPLETKGVYIVYQPSYTMSTVIKSATARNREDIATRNKRIDMLGVGVNTEISKLLQSAHIESKIITTGATTDASNGLPIGNERKPGWRNLYVQVVKDYQVCTAACSHQFTVKVSLSDVQSTKIDWFAELEEQHFTSIFLYQARYDELAREIGKSVLKVVKSTAS